MKKIKIVLIVLLITGCGNKENKPDVVPDLTGNINKLLIEEQLKEELDFNNISLVVNNSNTVLEATVTNKTDNDITINLISIVIKDTKENLLVDTKGYVGGLIKPTESKKIIVNIDMELNENYIIEIKKES